jgi:hypothetical protein
VCEETQGLTKDQIKPRKYNTYVYIIYIIYIIYMYNIHEYTIHVIAQKWKL